MKSIVAFLSRPHGFNVLNYLVNSREFDIIQVYTHSLNPKSQDPDQKIRNDFKRYEEICNKKKITLISVNSKNEQIIIPNVDYIIEVSWRYLIPKEITSKAKIASFGIHRGKLPDYAGAEPIKQALLKGETEIILSAHYLDDVIDHGSVISSISYKVNYENSKTIEENVQRLRDEITPLFSKLAKKTFKIFEKKN